MILTSNLPVARWGDVFGDLTIASVMIDRIVHHAPSTITATYNLTVAQ